MDATTLILLGGLAVAGYLVYKHYNQTSASSGGLLAGAAAGGLAGGLAGALGAAEGVGAALGNIFSGDDSSD